MADSLGFSLFRHPAASCTGATCHQPLFVGTDFPICTYQFQIPFLQKVRYAAVLFKPPPLGVGPDIHQNWASMPEHLAHRPIVYAGC